MRDGAGGHGVMAVRSDCDSDEALVVRLTSLYVGRVPTCVKLYQPSSTMCGVAVAPGKRTWVGIPHSPPAHT